MSGLIYLLVALARYRLLKEVSENQATLMVAFVMIAVAVSFANSFNELAVLIVLSKPDFLSAFDPSQQEGLAYLFVRLQSHGIQIIQIFWGLWLIPMGSLVYRSGFIPKIIGVSVWLAAFGYLMSNFTFLLLPQYKAVLSPIITGLEMLELPIIFWLVIVGVRTPPVRRPEHNSTFNLICQRKMGAPFTPLTIYGNAQIVATDRKQKVEC